jgi:hypothetical protein
VYLYSLPQASVPLRGLLTRVTVDGPSSQITETNEGNNTREARIAILDISCSAPRDDLELSKLYMQGGWDFRVKFKIRVRHNLAQALHNVPVKWELFDSGGMVRGAHGEWTIASLAAGEEWVKHVDQKFGKQGNSNAHEPKLREGTSYRVVASISDPEDAFFDVTPGNDSSSFSFSFPD